MTTPDYTPGPIVTPDGIFGQMSADHARRAIEALNETHGLLAREMRYLPHLRKMDYIASLERHVAKLTKMIETNEYTPDHPLHSRA